MNSTNLIEDLRLLSPRLTYRAWWAVAVLVLAAAGVLVVIRIWRRRSRVNTARVSALALRRGTWHSSSWSF